MLQSYEIVLRKMVEGRIAQYLNTTLTILKEQFGFDEKQLTEFAQQMRRQAYVSQAAKTE